MEIQAESHLYTYNGSTVKFNYLVGRYERQTITSNSTLTVDGNGALEVACTLLPIIGDGVHKIALVGFENGDGSDIELLDGYVYRVLCSFIDGGYIYKIISTLQIVEYNSIYLDGSNIYGGALRNNTATFDFYNQPFSILAYVKPTTTGEGWILGRTISKTDYQYLFWVLNGELYFAQINPSVTKYVFVKIGGLMQNAWNKVGVTCSGNNLASGIKLYLNGSEGSKTILNDNLDVQNHSTAHINIIGASGETPSSAFYIDDLVVSNRVLTPTEVEEVHGTAGKFNFASASFYDSDVVDWFKLDGNGNGEKGNVFSTFGTTPAVYSTDHI